MNWDVAATAAVAPLQSPYNPGSPCRPGNAFPGKIRARRAHASPYPFLHDATTATVFWGTYLLFFLETGCIANRERGLALYGWASATLGSFFRTEVRLLEGHRVVTGRARLRALRMLTGLALPRVTGRQ
jgi:hypothetical protein